jgi:hypothetical protein
MTVPTLEQAETAVEEVRRAAEIIGRVRDVQVQVRCAWQQIDDLPDASAAELKHRLAEATKAWLAEQPQAVRPHFEVKTTCRQSADINTLAFSLPTIWQAEVPHE